jgi:hypothetical protein
MKKNEKRKATQAPLEAISKHPIQYLAKSSQTQIGPKAICGRVFNRSVWKSENFRVSPVARVRKVA